MKRLCLGLPDEPCGALLELGEGNRCAHHRAQLSRSKNVGSFYGTKQWRKLAAAVKARDGHGCVTCGGTHRLIAHHVQPRGRGGADDLSNLVTTCHACHRGTQAS